MSIFKKRETAAFVLSLSLCCTSILPAFAEGSRNLAAIPTGDEELAQKSGTEAYRPYLEWRDRYQFNMPSENVINVYANKGETVLFGSSVTNANDRSIQAVVEPDIKFTTSLNTSGYDYTGASIAVTLPTADGSTTAFNPSGAKTSVFVPGSELKEGADTSRVYLFNVTENGIGHIANPTQEKNGPNGVDGQTKGYEPLSFIAPYTGTYSFRFLSSEYAESDLVPTPTPSAMDGKATFEFENIDVTTSPINQTFTNGGMSLTIDSSGTGNDNRYWTIKEGSYTVGEKTYTKRIESNKITTSTNGFLEIKTKHYPCQIKIVWGFSISDGQETFRQLCIDDFNNKVSARKTANSNGDYWYEDVISNPTPNVPFKLLVNGGAAYIYSIEYIYDTNGEIAAGSTVPPLPTREPLDRKVSDAWANSPSEVAAWDVTVAEAVSTETPEPTSEPTAEPTTAPATEPIVWDLVNATITQEGSDAKTGYIVSKDGETKLYVNNGQVSANDGVKLNVIDETKFDKNYFKFTPTLGGTLTINAKASTNTAADITIRQTEEKLVCTADKSGQEGSVSVEAGKEVYIYTKTGNAYFKTITFTPTATESAAALAEETTEAAASSGIVYKEKPGRVWADLLFLNAGNYKRSIYPQLNVLTQDGFLYDLKLNGIQPYGFLLYSNNRGFLFDNYKLYSDNKNVNYLTPLEHSFYSKGSTGFDVGTPPIRDEVDSNGNPIVINGQQVQSTILGNYEPTDPNRDFTHKMFFNTPDSAALEAYTGSENLKTSQDFENASKDVLDSLSYTGKGNYADNTSNSTHYGTMGVGGDFTVTLTDDDIVSLKTLGAKNISVTLDFSGYKLDANNRPVTIYEDSNKRYIWQKSTNQTDEEKHNIVTLTATVVDKTTDYTLSWNGLDAYGNAVPAGEYAQNIKSFVEVGMAHFPILDAENNPNGIKIKMVNEVGAEADRDKVYYNNQAVSPKTNEHDATAWYYAKNDNYPSKIGDGLNRLGGVSSNFDDSSKEGVMTYGSYSDNDKINDNAEWGYGNYAALDMWTKYEINQSASLSIGVKEPEQVSAYLSFVAENGEASPASTDAPFTKSHLKYAGTTLKEDASIKGESEIYGNTISTGFRTNIKIDSSAASKYVNWEVTIPNPKEDSKNTLGSSYMKFDDSQTSTNELETAELYNALFAGFDNDEPETDNFGDDASGIEGSVSGEDYLNGAVDMGNSDAASSESYGDDAVQFLLDAENEVSATTTGGNYLSRLGYDAAPVLEDSDNTVYNKGKIYRITTFYNDNKQATANDLKIKISQALGTTITVSDGTTVEASVGLVIDNLYAPNATASADYGDKAYDVAVNAIAASGYSSYLSQEGTIGYNPDYNKNYRKAN